MQEIYSTRRMTFVCSGLHELGRLKPQCLAISPLFHNALACIDELEYLVEHDEQTFGGPWNGGRWTVGSHELSYAFHASRAHARWAAINAFTCIDVCAAMVGRVTDIARPPREVSFSALKKKQGKLAQVWRDWGKER
jgi:hypothetical protein